MKKNPGVISGSFEGRYLYIRFKLQMSIVCKYKINSKLASLMCFHLSLAILFCICLYLHVLCWKLFFLCV